MPTTIRFVDAYFQHQENHGKEAYALESIELLGALSIQSAEQHAAAVEPTRRPRP
jgi:hypothetical protein